LHLPHLCNKNNNNRCHRENPGLFLLWLHLKLPELPKLHLLPHLNLPHLLLKVLPQQLDLHLLLHLQLQLLTEIS
jgi:hypothetical protein